MLRVARIRRHSQVGWAVVRDDHLLPIAGSFDTTRQFLRLGRRAAAQAFDMAGSKSIPVEDVELLSPITEQQQIICLAKNYRAHAVESGTDPDTKAFNMVFRKASSCLCGARDEILRPSHVRLLDYEVELGLVLGRDVIDPARFAGTSLPEAIGALVIHNDVSARDIQLPQSQFYKGKSFRTFGPTGPWLTLVDSRIRERWRDLRLQLRVNDELRQDAVCADMVYGPAETLTELSEVQTLRAGDLIASGTPAGVALRRSPKQDEMLASLPEIEKWRQFIDLQASNGRYLAPGDRVVATIRTDDGEIDLGTLDNRVAPG